MDSITWDMNSTELSVDNGTCSFTMPAGNVNLSAAVEKVKYPAPGGTVTSYDTLLTALGGSQNAALKTDAAGQYAELLRSVSLEEPLEFIAGTLVLRGADDAMIPKNQIVSPSGKSAFLVNGADASLTLKDTEIACDFGAAASRDALKVSGGVLNVADLDPAALTPAAMPASVFGKGDGAALRVTGGMARISGGSFGLGGNKSGEGVLLASSGAALIVEGSPTVELTGGSFSGVTYYDKVPQILGPSVKLPSGMKLGDLIPTGFDINLLAPSESCQTAEQALAASEVQGNFSVISAALPDGPALTNAEYGSAAAGVDVSGLTANALLVGALYDPSTGRMLACATAGVSPAPAAARVTLRFSGAPTGTVKLKLFLLDALTQKPLVKPVEKTCS